MLCLDKPYLIYTKLNGRSSYLVIYELKRVLFGSWFINDFFINLRLKNEKFTFIYIILQKDNHLFIILYIQKNT